MGTGVAGRGSWFVEALVHCHSLVFGLWDGLPNPSYVIQNGLGNHCCQHLGVAEVITHM
jgi:hypothetical protein